LRSRGGKEVRKPGHNWVTKVANNVGVCPPAKILNRGKKAQAKNNGHLKRKTNTSRSGIKDSDGCARKKKIFV